MAGNLARADQLCDMAADVIRSMAVINPIPGTRIEVEVVDDDDFDTSSMPTGLMKVAVSWVTSEDAGPVSRSEQARDILLSIVSVEVCEEAGKVPLAWRRTRSDWFEKCVVDAIGEARNRLDGAYSLREDAVGFNLDELTERKTFWCVAGITLRDVRKVR